MIFSVTKQIADLLDTTDFLYKTSSFYKIQEHGWDLGGLLDIRDLDSYILACSLLCDGINEEAGKPRNKIVPWKRKTKNQNIGLYLFKENNNNALLPKALCHNLLINKISTLVYLNSETYLILSKELDLLYRTKDVEENIDAISSIYRKSFGEIEEGKRGVLLSTLEELGGFFLLLCNTYITLIQTPGLLLGKKNSSSFQVSLTFRYVY